MSLDLFTAAYVECALWSSTDNGYRGKNHPDNDPDGENTGGDPLDKNYSVDDIAPETLAEMIADCAAFQKAHEGDIAGGLSRPRAGHDFWLTRNGHGCGFWDGDWPEPQATRLTEAAEAFGSYDLYVGDDGKVHGS
jgi:hypothetical protein